MLAKLNRVVGREVENNLRGHWPARNDWRYPFFDNRYDLQVMRVTTARFKALI